MTDTHTEVTEKDIFDSLGTDRQTWIDCRSTSSDNPDISTSILVRCVPTTATAPLTRSGIHRRRRRTRLPAGAVVYSRPGRGWLGARPAEQGAQLGHMLALEAAYGAGGALDPPSRVHRLVTCLASKLVTM